MRQLWGAILFTALISITSEAQTIRKVPGTYPSIQSAIAASQSGDTVRVAPGVYFENINFLGKSIAVVSEAGADVTTIDGGALGAVVQIVNGEGPNTSLDGFTIRNGKNTSTSTGGGIQVAGSPAIRHNRIVSNAGCAYGMGILITGGSPIIQANLINNNFTQGCSGGSGAAAITVTTPGSTQILDNTISNNSNNASSEGGAISVGFAGPTLIRGNIITGNKATYGGGIGISAVYNVTIIQNLIAANTASQGGGIYWLVPAVDGGVFSITNNTIIDNSVTQSGSAIYASGPGKSNPVSNNLIIGKSGQAAFYCNASNSMPALSFNNVYSDQAAAYAGSCAGQTGANANISVAPLFVDRAAQNFRLLSGSAGIDTGTNSVVSYPYDLDTFPRTFPFGGTVDMGAYEFATPTTSITSVAGLTFADQTLGSISPPHDVVITNTGTANLVVGTVAITGDFQQTNTCQLPEGIVAGQSCIVSVRFAPAAGGMRSGQLTFTSNSGSSVVSLAGNGVGPVSLSTSSIAFVDQRIGTISPPTTLSFSNTGSVDVNVSSITVTGDYSSSNDCPAILAQGTFCTVTIRFAPTAMGTRFGAITINADSGLYVVTLSGWGVTPQISFSPVNVNFVNQAVGTTSAPQSVTVSNAGNIALAINSISYTGDFNGTNNCGSSLPANAACSISVAYSPTFLGAQTGVISVSDNADGSPHTVALSGTTNTLFLSANPASLSFGNQPFNTTSPSRTITLTAGFLSLSSLSIVASPDFSRSGTCASLSFLNANSSCNLSVTYKPTSLGPRTGTLVISDFQHGTLFTVPLSGTGVDVTVSPASLNFGNIHVGNTVTQTVTVTNNHPSPINLTDISISAGFSQTNNCGPTLATGANCSIVVTFTPATAGSVVSGTLAITDDAIGSPHISALSGRGVAGVVSVSSPTLTFEGDLVGTTSIAKTFTITNSGSGPLAFSGIAVTGDFANTTTCGATLAVNGSCSVSVKFSPTGSGTRLGWLIIESDALTSPGSVNLVGTGLSSLPIPVITGISRDNNVVGASGITLTVTGSGFSILSLVRWGGSDRPTTFISSSSLSATIPASDFASMGTIPVTVFNPSPGGGTSNGPGFIVYRGTTLTTRDLVYDRVGSRIYASVGSAAPSLANTLTPLNAISGVLGSSLNIGSNPGKLAISKDSSSIYVALDGTAEVRRFDTVTQTPGLQFGLGADLSTGVYFASDIAVAPGAPDTIAISRRFISISSSQYAGVAIYDNGVQRPTATPKFISISDYIQFDATPTTLYGFNAETTEFGVRKMSVDASGVAVTNVQTNLINVFGVTIQFEGGRIYSSDGKIIDPVNLTLVGSFSLPSGGLVKYVVADASLGRAFFLISDSNTVKILAYDLNTFALTGSVTLPSQGDAFSLGSFIRWGEDGLAFRSATQVITFQIPQSWTPTLPTPLTITKIGTGNGTVASIPAGIDCGVTCSAPFDSGQGVTLTTTAAPGSVFIGWSGNPDCVDGSVSMSTARSCIARFDLPQSNLTRLRGDSNGDGRSDILWQHSDGSSSGWLMSGTAMTGGAGIMGPGTGWSIKARADFNGDGKTDIVWQRSDGSTAIWLMNGFNLIAGAVVLGPGTGWSVTHVGDFNGDGKSDLIWEHVDGWSAIWLMDGLNQIGGAGLLAAGEGWKVLLIGDFDDDGKSDIVWQNADGRTSVWLMNGLYLSSGAAWLGPNTGWTPTLTGDFNGDGKSDILWQHTDGSVAMWLVDGLGLSAGAVILGPATGWTPKDVGDFNGDGKSDIVWQHTDGSVAMWLVDGLGILSGTIIRPQNTGYSVNRVGDFDGDGKADILWQHTDGSTNIWLMNGLTPSNSGPLLGPGTGWSPVP